RRHLVYPAGFGQDAALTAHRAVIHSRVPRFATLKGKARAIGSTFADPSIRFALAQVVIDLPFGRQ
ncbi:MAG: hypothetical protein IJM71_00320, partial [Clostridia bacterium]|nr:hypothetical protein [Clostridia bacterium]